jgi:hypothetical protein
LNEARVLNRQLEKAHAVQKSAENNAAATQRKQAEAERESFRARGELEELRERFERGRPWTRRHPSRCAKGLGGKIPLIQVYALTSSQSPHETLGLFLARGRRRRAA